MVTLAVPQVGGETRPSTREGACRAAILLADDHPANLMALEAVLAPLGQELVTAAGGKPALALLQEREFAVALLDVRMPDMDGFEVARLARKQQRLTPIIFVTATPDDARLRERGFNLGAFDFLVKPLDAEVLRSKVQAFIELWQQREELRRQTERHKAELERARLAGLLMQAPAAIAITRGPEFVFEFVNPQYEQVVGRKVPIGSPLVAALPELAAQPSVVGAMRKALHSGEPFVGREFKVLFERAGSLEEVYFDLVYQPVRDGDGAATHLLTHAVEVTGQVHARRRTEALAKVTAGLARSLTAKEVAQTLVGEAHDVVGAAGSVVYFRESGSQQLRLAAARGVGAAPAEDAQQLPLDAQLPLATAARTGQPVWLESRAKVLEAFPQLATTSVPAEALQAVAALPLSTGEQVLGAIAFTFRAQKRLDANERAFLEMLVGQCLPALERASLYDELKRKEVELRESERRFRAVAEAVPQIVYSTRAEDGLPDYYNSRWYEYTGLPAGSLDPDAWSRVCHPEDLPLVAARWQQSHASGQPFECELRLRRADGAYRWHLARSVAVRDESGRIVRWLGSSTDIDGQRRAREVQSFFAEVSKELSSSLDYELTLRSLAKLVVPRFSDWCAVDVLDAAGTPQRLSVEHSDPQKVSLAHELHLRYPPDLSAPHGLGEVLRTGRTEWMRDIPDALLVAAARDPEHLRMARELGLKSYVVVPLKRGEQAFGAITFVQAESDRRYTQEDVRLAEELALRASLAIENARLYRNSEALNETLEQRVRERTRALEETNRELEAFSYSVSHDLRAPLRHITGFAQLLQKRASANLDETANEFLSAISEAAHDGGKLVDELLAFSRMGRVEMRKSGVALSEMVASVQTEVAREAEGRDIVWQITPLPEVKADPAMLRLVVRNLLANAVKYTRPRAQATIAVSAEESPTETHVIVRDNGVGFDMRYVDKLFGVFQRLHTAEQFEGTGIGLANVRRIISRHGGRVWAEGILGEGATFHFTLPRDVPEEPADE